MANFPKALFLIDTISPPQGVRVIYLDPNVVVYIMIQFGPLTHGFGNKFMGLSPNSV